MMIHAYNDPAVYDDHRNLIGTVPQAPGGHMANVMDGGHLVQIAGIYPTRAEAEAIVWAAYRTTHPAARPAPSTEEPPDGGSPVGV